MNLEVGLSRFAEIRNNLVAHVCLSQFRVGLFRLGDLNNNLDIFKPLTRFLVLRHGAFSNSNIHRKSGLNNSLLIAIAVTAWDHPRVYMVLTVHIVWDLC